MEKGYYVGSLDSLIALQNVAIHNKNGKGLLHPCVVQARLLDSYCRNPQ